MTSSLGIVFNYKIKIIPLRWISSIMLTIRRNADKHIYITFNKERLILFTYYF